MKYTKKEIIGMTNRELVDTLMGYCCMGYGEILGNELKRKVCKWILIEMTNRGFKLSDEDIDHLLKRLRDDYMKQCCENCKYYSDVNKSCYIRVECPNPKYSQMLIKKKPTDSCVYWKKKGE